MAKEVERKYLVKTGAWTPKDEGTHFKQGYLNSQKERVVRVRIEGHKAKLTIKGLTTGVSRSEFEYAIPEEDAAVLLDQLCEQLLIDKHRHLERHGGHTWEIDVFHGDNEGLVGEEVSSDPRYFNSNLLKHPFKTWR